MKYKRGVILSIIPLIYYPLKALLAYPLTTLNNAKIAVIPRATRIIVGNQSTRVVQKLLTKLVNPVVNSAGIVKAFQDNITNSLYLNKSHIDMYQ